MNTHKPRLDVGSMPEAAMRRAQIMMEFQKNAEHAKLMAQRDELLKALRDIAEWTERYTTPGHAISTIARAAIAKATGGAV